MIRTIAAGMLLSLPLCIPYATGTRIAPQDAAAPFAEEEKVIAFLKENTRPGGVVYAQTMPFYADRQTDADEQDFSQESLPGSGIQTMPFYDTDPGDGRENT